MHKQGPRITSSCVCMLPYMHNSLITFQMHMMPGLHFTRRWPPLPAPLLVCAGCQRHCFGLPVCTFIARTRAWAATSAQCDHATVLITSPWHQPATAAAQAATASQHPQMLQSQQLRQAASSSLGFILGSLLLGSRWLHSLGLSCARPPCGG